MSSLFSSVEEARERIAALVDKYAQNVEQYRHSSYNEETARSEFISPFFEALGWDVTNRQALAPAYKDVIHEESQRTGELGTKAPDYTFRVGGQRKFFVEAKKPFIDVKNDPAPANQLRRYAWTAKLPLSILTDFEEFAVYDTRKRPGENDKAAVARIQLIGFEDYLPKLDDLWKVFSKEAVYKGSFDRYAEETLGKRGTSEVDAEFLKELERWRDELARNIALRNTDRDLSVDELNFAVQATIDRILFLRIAEGRGVEGYGQLQGLTNGENVYPRLMHVFRKADAKYNSGIFDFKTDRLTPKLDVDDKVLRGILGNLYYPQSPYEFSVLPPEILGNVYEQFLGKVIRLMPSGRAKIEEKPEVKKAGGVYYTPTYIVDYIVKHTVGKLCEGKTPKEMAKLRIVDPACGSGSFLLVAFQTLMDAHLAWYRENNPAKHTKEVFLAPGADENNWRLTTAEKRRILLNSIYGVDIDRQAVEVTKLSLLLRVLEGENAETLKQHAIFGERALPSLEANIKCGNSLIGTDAFKGALFPDPEDLRRINPFDWQSGFPEVFKAGGFDALIGNPPYIRMESFKDLKPYLREHYKSHQERADLYVYFIERSHQLLRDGGRFGMIVSNKFLRANYGRPLRETLPLVAQMERIADFAGLPVFQKATVRTVVLITTKNQAQRRGPIQYSPPPSPEAFTAISQSRQDIDQAVGPTTYGVPPAGLDPAGWSFAAPGLATLVQRIGQGRAKLVEYTQGRICMGVKSGLIDAFVITGEQRQELLRKNSRAGEAIKPFLNGRDVRRYRLQGRDQFLIYAHHGFDIGRYPAIEAHLRPFKDQLLRRATKQAWYELQQPQHRFAPFMEGPKLIFPDMATSPRFALDERGQYCANTCYFIPGRDLPLLALLNSRLGHAYFIVTCAGLEGAGETYLRFFGQYLEGFPVADCGGARRDRIESLTKRMMELQADISTATTAHDRDLLSRQIEATDREIDRLVYDLYELTDDEITIVENATVA